MYTVKFRKYQVAGRGQNNGHLYLDRERSDLNDEGP